MTRLAAKLSLPVLISKSAHSLSVQLARFSFSPVRLIKSLLKVPSLIPSSSSSSSSSASAAMDDSDLYSFSAAADDDDHHLFDLTSPSSSVSSSHHCHRNRNSLFDDDHLFEKLYLVPYRWWEEARSGGGYGRLRVLYNVVSEIDNHNHEIVLHLRKQNVRNGGEDGVSGSTEVFSARTYALITESMLLWALYRLRDSKVSMKGVKSLITLEDQLLDVFPLQIKLSVSLETSDLTVTINRKENVAAFYMKACSIFGPQSEMFYIWDFSGQTAQFLMNDRTETLNDSVGKSGKEIPMELHVHGFVDMMKKSEEKIDQIREKSNGASFGTVSVIMNGNADHFTSYSTQLNLHAGDSSRGVYIMGLRGMQNLGNTCFMNSAIQCLAHTPKLIEYFLGSYTKEINYENPLGMKGELALAFGDLLRKLWAPGCAPMAPTMFKQTLSKFANQFSGYNQHDSQEFLSFLLDGLHEDLNRVKHKPYIEAKDADGRPDYEVADEYWQNHLARNDSIIVDLCQGQYRSTLICPHCKTKSVTFDPFMYLSLPLPSTTMRSMTLTVMSTDEDILPSPVTISVPKYGRLSDLIEALSIACSLRENETLLVAEVFKHRVVNFLVELSDSLALIRDDDRLVAYRLPRDVSSTLVVFLHERLERLEKPNEYETTTSNWKLFGIPLVARLSALSTGSDLSKQYLKYLNPFVIPSDDELNDYDGLTNEDSAMEDVIPCTISDTDKGVEGELDDDHSSDFRFCLFGDIRCTEIKMNEQLPVSKYSGRFDVMVKWSEKMIEKYDTCLLSSLPAVFKSQLYTRRPQESISLYKCLEAFLKEEPLGPEDMWYCPSCKKHRQANKKLDLWRLPEILVVHLKRFSYTRIFKNKLETYVDFPIDDLDLSTYISHKYSQLNNKYVLSAIINHYGGMGGGHYTAFVDQGHCNWHEFDDDKVLSVMEESIKTYAAYVLFYKRVG